MDLVIRGISSNELTFLGGLQAASPHETSGIAGRKFNRAQTVHVAIAPEDVDT